MLKHVSKLFKHTGILSAWLCPIIELNKKKPFPSAFIPNCFVENRHRIFWPSWRYRSSSLTQKIINAENLWYLQNFSKQKEDEIKSSIDRWTSCSLNVQVKDPIPSFKIPSINTTEVVSTLTESQVDPSSPRGLVWPFYKKNPEWVIFTVFFHPSPFCLTMNKSLKSFGFCSPSILT